MTPKDLINKTIAANPRLYLNKEAALRFLLGLPSIPFDLRLLDHVNLGNSISLSKSEYENNPKAIKKVIAHYYKHTRKLFEFEILYGSLDLLRVK